MGNNLGLNNAPVDPPATVLLVGEHFEPLQPALRSLAGQRDFRIVSSPDGHVTTDHGAAPSLILALPGYRYSDLTESREKADSPISSASILLCITHENLGQEELYGEVEDFLVVPCSGAELDKRLRRLASRSRRLPPSGLLKVGKITLNVDTFEVTLNGHRLELAWLEFQLLKFLMQHPGKVFTRDQLLASVWEVENFGGTRTVDVHIRRLRNKLEVSGERYFRTVKNVGYGLTDL
ncbi:MAG: winged helix-turn-helix domain-containing protein [Dehalococcoidia bacterium]